MTERPFVLLTKDACPDCERLKTMLARPLKGQFDGRIHVLHQREAPEVFMDVARRFNVMRTPALVHVASGDVLLNTAGIGNVRAFLTRGT